MQNKINSFIVALTRAHKKIE